MFGVGVLIQLSKLKYKVVSLLSISETGANMNVERM